MLRKLGQKIGVRTEKIQSTLGIDPGSAVSEDEHITPTAIIQNRFKMALLHFFSPKTSITFSITTTKSLLR